MVVTVVEWSGRWWVDGVGVGATYTNNLYREERTEASMPMPMMCEKAYERETP